MSLKINWISILLVLLFAITQIQTTNLIHILQRHQANAIFRDHQRTLMLFLGDLDQESSVYEVFSLLPNKYPDVMFTYSKVGEEPYLKLIQLVGVANQKMPIVLYFTNKGDKFLYKIETHGQITSKNIAKFVNLADNGNVPLHFRSDLSYEDISDEKRAENQKYLTYFTSYTLQQARENPQKQLVVIVYAFWCQYSQKFSPIFTTIAKELSVNPNLHFGKIDAQSNQIRGYTPQGYPEILFFKGDKTGHPEVYQGQRAFAKIIDWIKQTTTKQWIQPQIQDKTFEQIERLVNQEADQIEDQVQKQEQEKEKEQVQQVNQQVEQQQL